MLIDAFMGWWNSLAKKNGKLKFRNQREAAEFVRRVGNANGGPNEKLMEMRKQYEVIQAARNGKDLAESCERQYSAI